MNTLILDCSAGMSIYVDASGSVYEKIDSNQKKHTDELLVSVDKLLSDAGISVKELDNIGVCIGPGSFTGIRVAVSIAKGLSIGTGAKLFVCSDFDKYSFGQNGKNIYILDGFSDYVFVRVSDEFGNKDSCSHFSDVAEKIKTMWSDYNVFVQSEKLQIMLKNCTIDSKIAENKTILCFDDMIKSGKSILSNQISPIYLRESQAEIELKKKTELISETSKSEADSEIKRAIIGDLIRDSRKMQEQAMFMKFFGIEPPKPKKVENENLVVEAMKSEDVEEVTKIESELIKKIHADSVESAMTSDTLHYFVLKRESGEIAGFIEISIISPDCELYVIAVKKEHQGKHYADKLMQFMINYAKENKCETIFLEVNSINSKAIRLYRKYGFKNYSIRKNYYGKFDAVLMKLDLNLAE